MVTVPAPGTLNTEKFVCSRIFFYLVVKNIIECEENIRLESIMFIAQFALTLILIPPRNCSATQITN